MLSEPRFEKFESFYAHDGPCLALSPETRSVPSTVKSTYPHCERLGFLTPMATRRGESDTA
jgi:hypothetical protein